MTVVADAGPLMALAKVGGLEALFALFPKILTPPAVYHELISEGLRLRAPDAVLLRLRYDSGELQTTSPKEVESWIPALLGPGEEQSIRLALETQASWLLIDDLEARQAAIAKFSAAGATTRLKGTLGVILSACEEGHLGRKEAIGLVEALRKRPDIWISAGLCDRALEILGNVRE